MLQERRTDNFRISESRRKVEKEVKVQAKAESQGRQRSRASIQSTQESNSSIQSSSSQQSIQQQQNYHHCSCSNSSTSIEAQTETDNEQKQYEKRLNDFLPTKIGGLVIKKVLWSDFPGKVDPDMSFWAHIYWFINYNYSIEQRQNSFNKYLDFKVRNINVSVKISNKSWVRKQTEYLLSHEQGHYLIGCLCALDFKQQVLKKRFSINYSNEISQIFNSTLKHYSAMEIQYDEETNHSKSFEKQTQWFIFLYDQLKRYEDHFNPLSQPFSSRPSIENKENQPLNSNQLPPTTNKKALLPPISKPPISVSRPNKHAAQRTDSRSRRSSQNYQSSQE